jgi:hypothetical protein
MEGGSAKNQQFLQILISFIAATTKQGPVARPLLKSEEYMVSPLRYDSFLTVLRTDRSLIAYHFKKAFD